jgi:hypothetical protein
MAKKKFIIDKFVETVKELGSSPTGPEQEPVAGTANEQIFIPEATDAAAMPVPFTVPAKEKRKAAVKRPSKKVGKKQKVKRG